MNTEPLCKKPAVATSTANCTCVICGSVFHATPSRIQNNGAKYCSRACHTVAVVQTTASQRSTAECKYCGATFLHEPYRKQVYCSLSCRSRDRINNDLTGSQFERLTVVARDKSALETSWICTCTCGTTKSFRSAHLLSGNTRSCGCLARDLTGARRRIHGKSKTPEWSSWSAMLTRCYSPKHPAYGDYGGRGISVCERWRTSFTAFLEDMGAKPTPKHTIDRYPDPNGNYEPNNCRWATTAQQRVNTRKTVFLTVDGITAPLVEWSRTSGTHQSTIRMRLSKGLTHKQAIFNPLAWTRTHDNK